MSKPKSPSILYVSSFPPRECGIATFSRDLTDAIDKELSPGIKSKILAMNDNGTSIYNYPRKVIMQINESNIEDYLNVANEINKSKQVKLVNIQHEYGLFGGDWGNYLLPFMELVKKPIVMTFHTVLPRANEQLKKLTASIASRSDAIVVMTKTAARLLEKSYGVSKAKISIIPHGVHNITFPSKSKAKKKLNLSGKFVLSTFGMLNCDKGIEYAVEALPEIVKEFPDVLYLVIGATHPQVLKHEGEKYRNKLTRLVNKLQLNEHVKFYNRYLATEELIDYLKATDIYLSPTLNPKQAVSGTVSYALSCACPIIATANQYAKDVVEHNHRGFLVGFRDSKAIEKGLFDLLRDKAARKEMGKNSYFYSRHMTFQNVAISYFKLFNDLAKIVPSEKGKLLPINLGHIKTLTDKFGIIQFAVHTRPDIHSGYCLDDCTRALLGCAMNYKIKPSKSLLYLMNIYLNYIEYSQRPEGDFHPFVNYSRKFSDEGESEDSLGRAVWALCYAASGDFLPDSVKNKARMMLDKALKKTSELKFLRAISFALLGLCLVEEKIAAGEDSNLELIKKFADRMMECYKAQAAAGPQNGWLWFEDCMTYSNYKLPEALFCAYKITKNKEYLRVAEKSLAFLIKTTFEKQNYFSPIGQDGWFYRNGKRSYYDQQPEDTSSAVEALATAYKITGKNEYLGKAKLAYEWFLGKNHLNQMVYDEATGGCYDGLGRYSLNFNQGAESTLSYYLARLTIEEANSPKIINLPFKKQGVIKIISDKQNNKQQLIEH